MSYNEVEGNLITLAKQGQFDVIAHGCNCWCTMGSGIAPQMDKAFGANNPKFYPLEGKKYKGDINKLGQIDYNSVRLLYNKEDEPHFNGYSNTLLKKEFEEHDKVLYIVNAYTQYDFGGRKPFDDDAFILCMRKINHVFKGKHIGLPQIGAGLAGGNWKVIKNYIQQELTDVDVTVVIFKP